MKKSQKKKTTGSVLLTAHKKTLWEMVSQGVFLSFLHQKRSACVPVRNKNNSNALPSMRYTRSQSGSM